MNRLSSPNWYRPDSSAMTAALVLLTLLARIALVSTPYYVDGPNHVRAVENGSLFIQAPGYFLFAFTARSVVTLFQISAAHAISFLNIAFSVAGVWTFRQITRELFPGTLGLSLACAYAASNVVWFSAEIHSTYASTTFFGPLLFYALMKKHFVAGCFVWAALTGYRPSDGAFLIPMMIYAAFGKPWPKRLIGLVVAACICTLWYVPTFIHFGGTLFSPLAAAHAQLGDLPAGLVARGFNAKSLNNLLHFLFATANAWNILLPFAVWGAFASAREKWLAIAWIVPAINFFALYFISDSMYLAFLVGPGLVLAGYGLQKMGKPALALGFTYTSVAIACAHMLLLRPILPARTLPIAVVNSYGLEYTRWALKNRFAKRLSSALIEINR